MAEERWPVEVEPARTAGPGPTADCDCRRHALRGSSKARSRARFCAAQERARSHTHTKQRTHQRGRPTHKRAVFVCVGKWGRHPSHPTDHWHRAHVTGTAPIRCMGAVPVIGGVTRMRFTSAPVPAPTGTEHRAHAVHCGAPHRGPRARSGQAAWRRRSAIDLQSSKRTKGPSGTKLRWDGTMAPEPTVVLSAMQDRRVGFHARAVGMGEHRRRPVRLQGGE